MNAASRRVTSLQALLSHARERLGFDVGFVLWGGSTVPDDLAPDALAIAIADEGAVAALIRRPNLDTLANLWVAGRIDLRNGSLFDLVARRPRGRTKAFLRSLDKPLLLRTLARFALVPRGGAWPLRAIGTARGPGSTAAHTQKTRPHYHAPK